MLNEIVLLKDLTDTERMMFQSELAGRRKDPTTGVLHDEEFTGQCMVSFQTVYPFTSVHARPALFIDKKLITCELSYVVQRG